MAAQLWMSMRDHPHWPYDQDQERDGLAIGRRMRTKMLERTIRTYMKEQRETL